MVHFQPTIPAPMVSLPPGMVYFAKHLPRLATPPLLTYLMGVLASSYWGYDIPAWLHRAAITFSLPIAIALQVQWQLFKDKRAASSLGAVLPPIMPDWLPGGLRLLIGSRKGPACGYPSTWVQRRCRCCLSNNVFTHHLQANGSTES